MKMLHYSAFHAQPLQTRLLSEIDEKLKADIGLIDETALIYI